jgi:flagellar protein FlbD
MIKVTRLDGEQLLVNPDLIEFAQVTPDTILSLTTGRKVVVRESLDEVVERVIEFRRRIHQLPALP